MIKLTTIICTIVATLVLNVAHAEGKEYRMIVNAGPGSGVDSAARAVQDLYQKKTGNIIVLEYQPGGQSYNAANAFLNGRPSILVGNTALHAMNEAFYPDRTSYKDKDFNYVGLLAHHPILYYASAASGLKTEDDMIKHLQNLKPAAIGGNGLFNRINSLLFIESHNLQGKVIFVPYKTASETLTGVLSGVQPVGTTAPNPPLMGQVRAGKIVIIGSTWPGLEVGGILIPPLTNKFGEQLTGLSALSISKKFNEPEASLLKEQLYEVISSPEFAAKIVEAGLIPDPIPGNKLPEFFDRIRHNLRKYHKQLNLSN